MGFTFTCIFWALLRGLHSVPCKWRLVLCWLFRRQVVHGFDFISAFPWCQCCPNFMRRFILTDHVSAVIWHFSSENKLLLFVGFLLVSSALSSLMWWGILALGLEFGYSAFFCLLPVECLHYQLALISLIRVGLHDYYELWDLPACNSFAEFEFALPFCVLYILVKHIRSVRVTCH